MIEWLSSRSLPRERFSGVISLYFTLNDVNVVSSADMCTVELLSEEIGCWQAVDLKNTGIHSLSKLILSFKIWIKPHNITFQYLEISKKFVSKLFLHLQREQCHRHEGNWKTQMFAFAKSLAIDGWANNSNWLCYFVLCPYASQSMNEAHQYKCYMYNCRSATPSPPNPR